MCVKETICGLKEAVKGVSSHEEKYISSTTLETIKHDNLIRNTNHGRSAAFYCDCFGVQHFISGFFVYNRLTNEMGCTLWRKIRVVY